MKKRYIIPAGIFVFAMLLAAAGRLFRPFADFYADNIFPVISVPFAFLSGSLPFSLGEIITVAFIVIAITGAFLTIALKIFAKEKCRKVSPYLLQTALWMLAFISLTESLNCFTLYGCTRFSERFYTPAEHNNDELKELYAILIDECNELSRQVPRDEYDRFHITIDYVDECRKAMKKASEKYPQLRGYYPKPKPLIFSYLMSQMGTAGMYLPYAMEATYNADMIEEIRPEVICHEYAHLKGFMQEDEAGFISFIATQGSDNVQVRYSGCLNALQYVHNQIYTNGIVSGYELSARISAEVQNDWFRYLPDNYWEDNSEKEIISTETVDTVSDKLSDVSMKANGVEDGIASYSRIVNLLLDYYFNEN